MRNLGLDLLRFLAVFLVIFRHLPGGIGRTEALAVLFRGGWIGVDLFFVLSGFLISGLLFREHQKTGKLQVAHFLIRRGFKIYPPFWILLAVTVVALAIRRSPTPTRGLVGEILFLENYLGGLLNHTWSLAVEEHFYFGLAGLFALTSRLNPQKPFAVVPWAFAAVAVACLARRLVLHMEPQPIPCPGYHCYTHSRIDSLLFGVLLARAYHYADLRRRIGQLRSGVLVLAGCALYAPAFLYPLETTWQMSVFGYASLYVGSGCLVLAAVRLQQSRSVLLRAGGALGA